MEKYTIGAVIRNPGLTPKQLRKTGMIPGILYGHNVPTTQVAVSQNEFEKVARKAGESSLVLLDVETMGVKNVLIHEVQKDMVKSQPIHVDFYEVSMTEKLQTMVQLDFTGESIAVKALGGVLVKVLDEIEVECLPSDLPHNLPVDISALATFDDTIQVKDIQLPKGVTVLTPLEEVVAKIQPPREVEAELSAPVVEDVSKVEGVVKEEAPAEDTQEK